MLVTAVEKIIEQPVLKKERFSTVLLHELKRRGIDRIFGVPGRECAGILFDEVEGIDYITTRVEFTAGVAADFTGRLTRKPQVCFATMGPGATNMVTAVASARLNYSPLICFTAQLESDDNYYNLTHQCVDQTTIMEPVAKWSYELQSPEDILWAIDYGFKLAMQEPVGPVHIAIPANYLSKKIKVSHNLNRELPQKVTFDSTDPDPETLQAIYKTLLHSKSPLCLIGEGALRVNAGEAIISFCERWNIPFVAAANAKGIRPSSHPLNYGTASPYMEGILGYPALQDIYEPVDTLICIGYQYVDDLLPKMWSYGQEKLLVHIGATPIKSFHAKFNPDLECTGDISHILDALSLGEITQKPDRSMSHLKQLYKDIVKSQKTKNGRLTPIQIVDVVNNNIGNGIVCTDIGYYRHHAILFVEPKKEGCFFTDTGLSSFGSGLPSAIAAQLEYPDRQVVLICGDGGFHSGSGDLETLARYNLPVIVIVMNNNSFELISLYQKRGNAKYNRKVTNLGAVDFVKLSEANGCRGVFANSVEALTAAIASHDRSLPLVIEVPMEYRDREDFRESF